LKAEKYVKREAFRSCIENIDNKNNINKIKTKHLLQGIKFTPTLFIFDSQNSLVKKYESVGGIVGWNIIKNLLK
jgi:hypothetical protein